MKFWTLLPLTHISRDFEPDGLKAGETLTTHMSSSKLFAKGFCTRSSGGSMTRNEAFSWTDGRIWGQSRMREPYLFYDEKLPFDMVQASSAPMQRRSQTFRFVDSAPRNGPSSSALSHQDRTTLQHPGLVKQAYSAWVSPDPRMKPQKWHLTAYFTYAELTSLPTIDRDPLLRRIILPSGIYRSGNARSRCDEDVPTLGRSSVNGRKENRIPLLPSLQSTVPETDGDFVISPHSVAGRKALHVVWLVFSVRVIAETLGKHAEHFLQTTVSKRFPQIERNVPENSTGGRSGHLPSDG
ncbi:putative gti1/Pac2 family protein [Lyophyllum shimeji]|uniref:Gti1/Pac2 family protein n=1 Tax=Lyophyllum shimeji TaxID=47721 RepID=A0A9P3PEX7_LYOSH|nr:putative gti1/Pac2 family protein [Lyophyllum shimeji]